MITLWQKKLLGNFGLPVPTARLPPTPPHVLELNFVHLQHLAKNEISYAQHRGIPLRELAARWTRKVVQERDPNALATPVSDVFTPPEGISPCSSGASISNAEDGMPAIWRPKSRRALLAECRDRPRSAWLYFPHVELLFLLFAFEGAVASQVAALRDGGCPWVTYTACSALVSATTR